MLCCRYLSVMTPAVPLNAWYAAAWGHEVSAREVLARTVCEQDSLWRKPDGGVAAVRDSCWHRGLPLSMGHVGEDIVCRYHGLASMERGAARACPRRTGSARQRACELSDARAPPAGLVWPGDPVRADPALVPDLHWNSDPGWEGDGATLFARCDYRLLVDNLMDLTHETFVHATSIGHRAIAETPAVTTHDERTVTVTRWMLDIDAPPFWRTQRPAGQRRPLADHPLRGCTIVLDVGVALAGTGAPSGNRSQGVNGRVLNTITPETPSTCMYFWTLLRNYRLRDQSLTNQLRDANARIFEEDRAVVEAQQLALEAAPHDAIHNLNIEGRCGHGGSSSACWRRSCRPLPQRADRS